MTLDNKIRDRAYIVATENHLTKAFTYKQFQKADISKYILEPLQDWPEKELIEHITQIAEEIIKFAKYV